jgi:hypothetical protein
MFTEMISLPPELLPLAGATMYAPRITLLSNLCSHHEGEVTRCQNAPKLCADPSK